MSKQEFGDWQTPLGLARSALDVIRRQCAAPAVVLEPTCGEGSFLAAAAERYGRASLVGYEIDEGHAGVARARLPAGRTHIEVADFFAVDWDRRLGEMAGPILVTGNLPWVTSAALGSLGSSNLPGKRNFKGMSGYDALTGKSNFDISEWMLLSLIKALQGRRATVAVLCKTAVARRVVEFVSTRRLRGAPGGLWRVDTMRHFRAAVDAVLFVCEVGAPSPGGEEWPVYPSLEATSPSSRMAVVDGEVVADAGRSGLTAHLSGVCSPEWRSGLKHDCARVMELELRGGGWINGLGERVSIEEELAFPLVKSSDVANGAPRTDRAVIVPQRTLGEDTGALQRSAPRAWDYLCSHREMLRARKSSIYRGRPDFAIFGIGPYSFAPWKVAISGLYKRCEFTLLGPRGGKPVMVDDTCYFLPFAAEEEAQRALRALRSKLAQDFFSARVFWDAKRPIRKSLLQRLDLSVLLAELSGAVRVVAADKQWILV